MIGFLERAILLTTFFSKESRSDQHIHCLGNERMMRCTGFGFANGKKFPHYFFGMYTDYVGARAMVNGSDHATDIAAIAASFEKVLLKAKL